MVDSLEAEKIVLEGWKKERATLDAAIAMLESRIGARGIGLGGFPSVSSVDHIAPDTFFRMTIQEAIKKFLKMVGKPARAATEIVDALNCGGLSVAYPTVYTSLTRLRDKTEVVKAGENWGLDEWYPPAPSRIKSLTGTLIDTEVGVPPAAPVAPEEQKEATFATLLPSPSRKQVVEDFINKNGPSTRAEILAGTGIPAGTFAYCMRDNPKFIKGEDGKWRNVE
jgi:hypothetical protein